MGLLCPQVTQCHAVSLPGPRGPSRTAHTLQCFRCGQDQVPPKQSAGLVWPLAVLHGGPSQSPKQQRGICAQNLQPGFVLMNAVGCGEVTETETPASEGTAELTFPRRRRRPAPHRGAWGSPVRARRQTREPGEWGPHRKERVRQRGGGRYGHTQQPGLQGGVPCCPAPGLVSEGEGGAGGAGSGWRHRWRSQGRGGGGAPGGAVSPRPRPQESHRQRISSCSQYSQGHTDRGWGAEENGVTCVEIQARL